MVAGSERHDERRDEHYGERRSEVVDGERHDALGVGSDGDPDDVHPCVHLYGHDEHLNTTSIMAFLMLVALELFHIGLRY